MNAGENFRWGSFLQNDGHIVMPLSAARGSLVALRVMDCDAGKSDDLLGECLVDVDVLLAQAGPSNPTTLQLYRKEGLLRSYKPHATKSGDSSSVSLYALPETNTPDFLTPSSWGQGARRVRFVLVSANHLPSGDMVGSNDLYVKMYEVPPTAQPGAPLPEPPAHVTMPQARGLTFPFSVQLPNNMPSSLEGVAGVDYGFVRCSVYANLDVAWRADPSARAFINIVQPVPVSLPRLLAPAGNGDKKNVYGLRCCFCFHFCLNCVCEDLLCEDEEKPLGTVELDVKLARQGMVPGEIIPFESLRAVNATARPCVLRIQFVRCFDVFGWRQNHFENGSGGSSGTEEKVLTVYEASVPAGGEIHAAEVLVPLLAPDYHGWCGDLPEVEPLVWRTLLRVTLDVPDTVRGHA
jgi:hypothetical protein